VAFSAALITASPLVATSDVKFHEIFWREIFQEIIREIFVKYFKNFTMDYGCRLYSSLQQSVENGNCQCSADLHREILEVGGRNA